MFKRNIIGLCGYSGSGKDTAAMGLIEQGWRRIAFADPLRKMALIINPQIAHTGHSLAEIVEEIGWTEAKESFHEIREFLQTIGDEAVRGTFGDDAWVDVCVRDILSSDDDVVITDCRYPNEFKMIHRLEGYLIRIDRPGVEAVNGHASESHVADAPVDGVVTNSLTQQALWHNTQKMARILTDTGRISRVFAPKY